MADEIDFLFQSDSQGIFQYSDIEAIQQKLENWISTPRGSFWGMPDFGHTLRQFLHDPPTDTLASVIEAELADTLETDIPEVTIRWLRVEPSQEFDGYRLKIGWATDSVTGETALVVSQE